MRGQSRAPQRHDRREPICLWRQAAGASRRGVVSARVGDRSNLSSRRARARVSSTVRIDHARTASFDARPQYEQIAACVRRRVNPGPTATTVALPASLRKCSTASSLTTPRSVSSQRSSDHLRHCTTRDRRLRRCRRRDGDESGPGAHRGVATERCCTGVTTRACCKTCPCVFLYDSGV